MLGPRPDKDKGKLKRKWEEDGSDDAKEDSGPEVTDKELQDWKDREKKEEEEGGQRRAEDKSGGRTAVGAPPSTPLELKPGDGLRLGEGDDSRRSPDEIRIIREMLAQDIETFIKDNKIDPPAARDLRNETPPVQFAVLDRGNLMNCSNPSGALIGRIRDAKRGVKTAKPPPPGTGAPSYPQVSAVPGIATTLEMCGDFKRGVCKRGDACKYSHGDAVADANKIAASQPGLLTVPDVAPGSISSADIDRFVYESKLDAGAALAFRSEPVEVQEKVVAMGPLSGAANPGNTLMGRIRACKMGPAERASLPKPPPPPPHGQPGVQIDVTEEALKAIQSLAKRNAPGVPGRGLPVRPPPAPPPAAAIAPNHQAPFLALPPAPPPVHHAALQQPAMPMPCPPPQQAASFNANSIKLPQNASIGDLQLQEEAIRAIQAMNAP